MNLLLDPGGTRLKFCGTEGGRIAFTGGMEWTRLLDESTDAREWESLTDSAISAVFSLRRPTPPSAPPDWLGVFLARAGLPGLPCLELDPMVGAGFTIEYGGGRPGSDRIAAAVACHRSDPGGSHIIIDAGTCITVDLLSPGHWRGGAILPGLRLQAASVARAGLPVITPDETGAWCHPDPAVTVLGNSTDGALRAGIPWAIRAAVGRIAQAMKAADPCAQVILTGGDAAHFDGLEGWQTFADPNLVLRGGAHLLNEQRT